jgi:biotin operon repressor
MKRSTSPAGKIVARYDYIDEQGKLLYQVRRHHPKGFSVRTATDKTLLQHHRFPQVPYRLPNLLAADPNRPVFVVEGEKDADRLWSEGLIATTNAFGGGRGKWTRTHSNYLRGRNVVVLPDNDATGAEHGRCVAKSLKRIAKTVRVLDLPGLPHKGDVSDWLDDGHTIVELIHLADNTPIWGSSTSRLPSPDWRERKSYNDNDYTSPVDARGRRREIYGLPIPAPEKLLMVMLSEFDGPPQEELAAYLGLSSRRVRQMIRKLKDQGFIMTSKLGRRNSYRIDISHHPYRNQRFNR